MADAVKTKFDETITLVEVCDKYQADVGQVVIFLELMGGLTKNQVQDVLFLSSVAAAAIKVPHNMIPA